VSQVQTVLSEARRLKVEEIASEALTLGAVLPSYNEAPHIAGVLATMPDFVDRVFIVDDCSTDDTAQVVQRLADPRVTYIRHETNQGVGGATRTGFKAALEAGCSFVVKIDADGQMDPDDLFWLIEPLRLGLADYVKGNRFRISRPNNMPGTRKFGNIALSFLVKAASGYWHVFDPQCGYVAISAPALRQIDLARVATDYFFEDDMLIWLNSFAARVVDVPVATRYGSEVSQVRVGRVMWSFPWRLFRGWLWRTWRRHMVWDFDAVGALYVFGIPLVGFGLLFGAYHWWLSVATGVPATTGTVMIAVLPVVLGFQAILQGAIIEINDSPGGRETRDYAGVLLARVDR
jgi:dolichol-phosphate mannosyltransferase